MTHEAPRGPHHPRMQQVATAGSALAVALVPLVVGVLIAKGMATDPHTPVNALITGGGRHAGLPRAELRRRGHTALSRLRTAREGTARRCAAARGRRTRRAPGTGVRGSGVPGVR
ncbi:hypothetical protein ACIGQE_09915 [Streptomyces sp. NPDC053429]|uniref:hypothetical protein n=1 Tax=Streptomyces sp. NPDC053429 TaxID=3365702 RepID=UPI0037CFF102